MSEITKQDMIGLMYEFAATNPDYRKAMLSDPKALLAKQMQQDLPDNLKVEVVQETPTTFYLVAPHVAEEGDELWDRSGAKGLYAAIDVIIDRIEQGVGATPEPEAQGQSSAEVRELHVEAEPAEPVHILPRRVKPGGTARAGSKWKARTPPPNSRKRRSLLRWKRPNILEMSIRTLGK